MYKWKCIAWSTHLFSGLMVSTNTLNTQYCLSLSLNNEVYFVPTTSRLFWHQLIISQKICMTKKKQKKLKFVWQKFPKHTDTLVQQCPMAFLANVLTSKTFFLLFLWCFGQTEIVWQWVEWHKSQQHTAGVWLIDYGVQESPAINSHILQRSPYQYDWLTRWIKKYENTQ